MSSSNSTPTVPLAAWCQGPVALYTGDAETVLATLPNASVDTVVTSPPYWQLRRYDTGRWAGEDDGCVHAPMFQPQHDARCPACGAIWSDDQIGMEDSVNAYVERLVAVFTQVHRVLRPRGTVWLNLGDGYAGTGRARANPPGTTSMTSPRYGQCRRTIGRVAGLAPKNMIGLPWTVAFALRDSGLWILRNAIVWAKTNGQPSPVRDRLASGYEFVFLLTRSREYHFDLDAIRVPWQTPPRSRRPVLPGEEPIAGRGLGKNPGDVWHLPTRAVREAHFASFPVELPLRCIAAGCPPAGHVLDPFSGTATTGLAALESGRTFTGIDLNGEYTTIAKRRLSAHLDQPGDGRDG